MPDPHKSATGGKSADSHTSIIIIGAGASGIAAGRQLTDAGEQVVIVEARDRIGGRAHSDTTLAPYPIELGAEFIHGKRVLTHDLVRKYGLNILHAQDDDHSYVYVKNTLHDSDEWDEALDFDWEETFWEAATEHVEKGHPDSSLKTLLDTGNPELSALYDTHYYQLINNFIGQEYGAGFGRHGIYGFAEATYDGDGSGDSYIAEGYTALLTALAHGLDIHLNTPIERVVYDDTGITLIASDGKKYHANRVIITLPLGVLQSDRVAFEPTLPDWKTDAINGLGAGKVNKLILKFARPFWDDDMEMLYTETHTQLWWRPGINRDDEVPILTALMEDNSDISYGKYNETEAINAGIAELERIYDKQNLAELLVEGHFIKWSDDPYALMGYSYTPVNSSGLRDKLAHPVANRLFFAGEATNTIRPATVHGAIESGYRAADQVLALRDDSSLSS